MKTQKRFSRFLFAALLISMGIQTGNAQSTCQAAFVWTQLHPNVVGFSSHGSTGVTANTNFVWNFGNGTYAYGQSASGNFNLPGHYTVCLTITDSIANCNSTFCDTISVYGSVICGLSATTTSANASCPSCADGTASVQSVQGGAAPYSYSWSGKSGNTNQQSGLDTGVYSVCITDNNACQTCTSIVVSANTNNCHAGFSKSQTAPNTIAFTDLSTGILPSTPHHYDFGDGNSGYFAANPSHVYSVPGLYTVCLQIGDSVNTNGTNCSSMYCDTVRVTGTVICHLTVLANTYGSSCTNCANGMAYVFHVSGGTAPFTYAWSNGASTDSAFNLIAGTYTVCVTDANSCHMCSSVVIPVVSNTCNALFSNSVPNFNRVQFTNMSSGNISGSASYYWSFGDGSSDYSANPVHQYMNSGTYTVCLYMSDSTSSGVQCSSSFCDTIAIGNTGNCNLIIRPSSMSASCSSCADGSVRVNAQGGTAPYAYSWSASGFQTDSVSGLAPGTYTVCVTDSKGCVVCAIDTVWNSGATSCSANFVLHPDSLHPGNFTAINLASGTGVIKYYWNWGDNTMDSTATPVHTYPSAGLYDICLTIYDATGCTSTFCDTIVATRLPAWAAGTHTTVNVVQGMAAGIKEIQTINNWNIYPNPSSGQTTVAYTISQNSDIIINVYDLVGREVMPAVKISNQSSGYHETGIDGSNLLPGTYLVRISANRNVETKRLTVIK